MLSDPLRDFIPWLPGVIPVGPPLGTLRPSPVKTVGMAFRDLGALSAQTGLLELRVLRDLSVADDYETRAESEIGWSVHHQFQLRGVGPVLGALDFLPTFSETGRGCDGGEIEALQKIDRERSF